ncbi:nitrate/nitrite transporter NrtS [Ancylobacter dichloromethanicus]
MALTHSRRRPTVRRAIFVSLVVGTVLNLINHYDVFLTQTLSSSVLVQMGLTYLVPYLVSTYSQVAAIMEAHQGGWGSPQPSLIGRLPLQASRLPHL